MTAAFFGFRILYVDVSDFTAGSQCAGYHLTVADNTATDTGAQCYDNQILKAFAAALPHFAESCHISVVSCHNGYI